MNEKLYRFIYTLIFEFFITVLFFINLCSANTLSDWEDMHAYRPSPVLFLHAFGPSDPQSWTEVGVDQALNQYYSKYYTGYNPDPTILPSTRYPYLEIMDFGSSLIDRNSSIDTYKAGDRYVLTGQRRAGDPGWSDKVNTAIETLREYYVNIDGSSQKTILVGHSMGGLAARKYLKSYSYANQKIEKLIMIGTPNLGSMLATSTTVPFNRNRRWGGWVNFVSGWTSSLTIDMADKFLESAFHIDMHGDAVWDMDPTSTGSGFIRELNSNYSATIDHFAIAGKHWLGFNLGDIIVSLNSQLGEDVLLLKDKIIINATHWTESVASISGDNPLLKFLDSIQPELEITSPASGSEIYENSIHIRGRVYKEYLPADSTLTITVIRQEDGYTFSQRSLLKPSDLWIPNNPDSPVAEFDEIVNFPGRGTYRISLQVKNPAGLTSDIKDIWVKSVVLEGTNIIVHCHNPEGKEIASIEGMSQNSVEIYDGNTLIGYGAHNAETHNRPIAISAGTHTIKAKFNGMTLEQNINLQPNETQILTFTFTRISFESIFYPFILHLAGTTYMGVFFPEDFYVSEGLLPENPTAFNQYILQGTSIGLGQLMWYGNGYFHTTGYIFHSSIPWILCFSNVSNFPNSEGWTIWYSAAGGIADLKCSNIPYDLLGTAI